MFIVLARERTVSRKQDKGQNNSRQYDAAATPRRIAVVADQVLALVEAIDDDLVAEGLERLLHEARECRFAAG